MTKLGNKTFAISKKEMIQIIRDPSSILITVLFPIMLLFLFGYGISLDILHLKIGVALEDTSPGAQSLLQAFTTSPYFDPTISLDRRELIQDLDRGSIRGVVVIPSYFTAYQNTPSLKAPIFVIADGSETNTSNFVQNYVQSAIANWQQIQRFQEGAPLQAGAKIDPRYWFNRILESRYSLLSGTLAIIMTLIGTLLTALVVAREWERGTMEALFSTTATRFEIILGKLLPYFFLGMVSMFICVAASILFFGLPFQGSFLILLLVSSCFLFAALGMGFLISTLSKIQILAAQYSIIVAFLPSYILSGFLFEISSMPLFIQYLTYVIPARYFVESLQTLFLVGNVVPLITIDILCLLLIASFLYLIINKKFIKRLDSP